MLVRSYENLLLELSKLKSLGLKEGSRVALYKIVSGIPKLILWRIERAILDVINLNFPMWFFMFIEYHIYKDIIEIITSFFTSQ